MDFFKPFIKYLYLQNQLLKTIIYQSCYKWFHLILKLQWIREVLGWKSNIFHLFNRKEEQYCKYAFCLSVITTDFIPFRVWRACAMILRSGSSLSSSPMYHQGCRMDSVPSLTTLSLPSLQTNLKLPIKVCPILLLINLAFFKCFACSCFPLLCGKSFLNLAVLPCFLVFSSGVYGVLFRENIPIVITQHSSWLTSVKIPNTVNANHTSGNGS